MAPKKEYSEKQSFSESENKTYLDRAIEAMKQAFYSTILISNPGRQ